MLGIGLNTSASVTINVGVRKQSSFNQFTQALQELKASLREVSAAVGADQGLKKAVDAAVRGARTVRTAQEREAIAAQRKEVARQRLNARAYMQDQRNLRKQENAEYQKAAKQRAQIADSAMQEVARSQAARQASMQRGQARDAQAFAQESARRMAAALDTPMNRMAQASHASMATMIQGSKNAQKSWNDAFREVNQSHSKFLREKTAAERKAERENQRAARQAQVQEERRQREITRVVQRENKARQKAMEQAAMLGVNAKTNTQWQRDLLSRIDFIGQKGRGSYQMGGESVTFSGIDKNRFKQRVSGLRSYIAQLKAGSASTAQFAQAQMNLNSVLEESVVHSKRMRNDMAYRLDQTEKKLDAIFRAGFRLQMVGMDLNQIFMRIRDTFTGIMSTFGDFQYTLFRAGATMDMFDSSVKNAEVNINDLMEASLQLSRSSMLLPAADVAEAFYHWAAATGEVIRTSTDLRQNVEALQPIMQAALMTNTSYEQTIKGVYGILSQFYAGDITKATHVTELLFMQTQKTAAEFNDLINSFKMVGSVAAQNNTTFEDTVELFGRLADLGIRGTMAGRALRQMFIQNARPSGPAMKQWMELLGEDTSYDQFMTSGGRPLSAPQKIDAIARLLLERGYTDVQRNKFLASTTTANELPMLTALILQAQRAIMGLDKETKEYRITSERAHQFFQDNWSALSKTWNAVSGSVQRAWEHLQITLGSALSETLTPFMHVLSDIIENVRQWARANPQIVQAIGKFAAGLAAVAAAGGVAFTALGTLVGLLAGIALVFRATSIKIPLITGGIGAIVTVIAALIRNFDYLRDRFNEFLDIIGSSNLDLSNLQGLIGDVTSRIQHLVDTMVRSVADLLPHLGRFVKLLNDIGATRFILELLSGAIMTLIAAQTIRGIVSLATAFKGLGVSMLGLAGSTGPLGILSLFAGGAFALYASNIFGFADAIDELTKSFRNLRQELEEATSKFGKFDKDILSGARDFITSNPLHNREDFGNRVAMRVQGNLGFDIQNQLSSILPDVFGFDLAPTLDLSKEGLDELYKKYIDAFTKQVVDEALKGRDELNERLMRINVEPVDNEAFANVLTKFMPNTSAMNQTSAFEPDTWSNIAERIILDFARGGYTEENARKIHRTIQMYYGNGLGGEVIKGGVQAFIDFARSGVVDHVIQQQRTSMVNAYAPLMDQISSVISKGIVDAETGQIDKATQTKVYDLLFAPFNNMDSLADYVNFSKNPAPELVQAYNNYMSIISQETVEGASDAGSSAARDLWKAFTEGINDPKERRKGIVSALRAGSDRSQLLRSIGQIFSLKGVNPKAFFRSFVSQRGNSGLQLAIDEMVDGLFTSVDTFLQLNPNANRDKLATAIRSRIPTVKELRKMGFSKSRAEKIVRAMKREMKPLLDFLRDPLGSTTETPEDNKPKPKGGAANSVLQRNSLVAKRPKVPVPNMTDLQNTLSEARSSIRQVKEDVKTASSETKANLSETSEDVSVAFAMMSKSMSFGATKGLAVFNNKVTQMRANSATWGFNTGMAWAKGIKAGITVVRLAAFLANIMKPFAGNSPPTVGPLKEIDTWGYNIGTAWGESLGTGANDALARKLMDTKRRMYKDSIAPDANVSYRASSERKLSIEVDIKSSDGTADRKTQAEIRRGAMEALSLSEVSHLVSVT